MKARFLNLESGKIAMAAKTPLVLPDLLPPHKINKFTLLSWTLIIVVEEALNI